MCQYLRMKGIHGVEAACPRHQTLGKQHLRTGQRTDTCSSRDHPGPGPPPQPEMCHVASDSCPSKLVGNPPPALSRLRAQGPPQGTASLQGLRSARTPRPATTTAFRYQPPASLAPAPPTPCLPDTRFRPRKSASGTGRSASGACAAVERVARRVAGESWGGGRRAAGWAGLLSTAPQVIRASGAPPRGVDAPGSSGRQPRFAGLRRGTGRSFQTGSVLYRVLTVGSVLC